MLRTMRKLHFNSHYFSRIQLIWGDFKQWRKLSLVIIDLVYFWSTEILFIVYFHFHRGYYWTTTSIEIQSWKLQLTVNLKRNAPERRHHSIRPSVPSAVSRFVKMSCKVTLKWNSRNSAKCVSCQQWWIEVHRHRRRQAHQRRRATSRMRRAHRLRSTHGRHSRRSRRIEWGARRGWDLSCDLFEMILTKFPSQF